MQLSAVAARLPLTHLFNKKAVGLAVRGLNIALRGSTLISKFLLIFLLAKYLPPAEVGLYGLLAASIAYALMALGLDFYTFATRELIASPPEQWAAQLRDQGVLYLLVYLVLLPALLLVFAQGLLPWSLALWFFPLLVVEHVAQEFNRLLVAIKQPIWASVVLFVRSGLWALMVAMLLWRVPSARALPVVLSAWLMGATLACLLALWGLRGLQWGAMAQRIQWVWIKRGLRVALPFVLATLALRAIYTVDRYWIEHLAGLDVLAAYVVFAGIANAIMSFLDAAVFSFQYPKLLSAHHQRDDTAFFGEMKRLWRNTLMVASALALIAVGLAGPLVSWIGKPLYAEQMAMLHWAVAAVVLTALSMVPHYGLYAKHADRAIVYTHVASLPVFALATWLLVPSMGHTAVLAGLVTASTFLLIIKWLAYRQAVQDT